MMVAGHHYCGVERKVICVLEDFLPDVERWHGVETTMNGLNDVDPTQVDEPVNLPELVHKTRIAR
jgi:hypothetical protein